MNIWSSKTSEGFALPTVIITSVVMMTVLLVGLSSLSSISSTLNTQRQGQLAREAARAGIKLAQRCIDLGTVNWTDASPLRPGRGCGGYTSQTAPANFYVLYDTASNQRTTFTVGAPVNLGSGGYLIQANGIYETKRSSSATATTKTVSANVSIKYVMDASAVASVSDSGNLLVCAIVRNVGQLKDRVHCWGANADGRTGVGYFNSGFAACNNADPKIIYLVKDSTCAIPIRGQVVRNEPGDLRTSSGTTISRSRQLLDHEVKVIGGGGFGCTISENPGGFVSRKVFCWGSNNKDRLGAGGDIVASGSENCINITGSDEGGETGDTYIACSTPVQVQPVWEADGYYPYDISAGTTHACVLAKASNSATASGGVYCWGARGAEGKLGDGTTGGSSATPVRVVGVSSGFISAKEIGGANGASTCAVRGDERVVCWGSNDFMQLGQGFGNTTSQPRPVFVLVQGQPDGANYLTAKQVTIHGGAQSAGSESAHACAIGKNDPTYGPAVQEDKLYCWGSHQYGQIGDDQVPTTGPGKARLVSRVYATPDSTDAGTTGYSVQDVAVANKATCAIITITATGYTIPNGDKRAYCWGNHDSGLLGIGPGVNYPTPSPCSSGPTALGVYCDADSSDSNNSKVRSRPLPLDPVNLQGKTPTSVVGGAIRFCMIAGVDNYCWGRNQVGQVGDGTTNNPIWRPKASAFLNIVGEQVYF